jgi:hypothetical protein
VGRRDILAVCAVHDDDVGGESPLSEVGEAEGLVRPKGSSVRRA